MNVLTFTVTRSHRWEVGTIRWRPHSSENARAVRRESYRKLGMGMKGGDVYPVWTCPQITCMCVSWLYYVHCNTCRGAPHFIMSIITPTTTP